MTSLSYRVILVNSPRKLRPTNIHVVININNMRMAQTYLCNMLYRVDVIINWIELKSWSCCKTKTIIILLSIKIITNYGETYSKINVLYTIVSRIVQ